MVVLGELAVSYERGTPVPAVAAEARHAAIRPVVDPQVRHLQRYLAHKKQPHPLGPP